MGIGYNDLPNYTSGTFPDDLDSFALNDINGNAVPITRKASLGDVFRSRGGGSWKYINIFYSALPGERLVADISTSGFTITLPSSSVYTSDQINILVRPKSDFSTILTISSSLPINGDSTIYTIYCSKSALITFVYINPTIGWVVNAPTDTIYTQLNTKGIDIKTWSGNGTTQTIGNINVMPNLAIIKNYIGAAEDWVVVDSGRSPTNCLAFNTTAAETIRNGTVTALGSNKVVLNGSGSNTAGRDYVGYFFRRSADVGMDIIKYTGTGAAASFYHSLDAEPEFMIVKYLFTVVGGTAPATLPGWIVYHKSMLSLPENRYLLLNSTAVPVSASGSAGAWNSLKPTSSQLNVGSMVGTGSSLHRYIAYLFKSVPGVSSFGSYVGSGDSNTSPIISLGFQPRLLFIKNVSAIADWVWIDTSRNTSLLPASKSLSPTSSAIEVNGDSYNVNILSNGFQPMAYSTFTNVNALNNVYIYGAWA